MGTPYTNAAGLTPEDVYDPDVVGDGPDAAISGIGYRRADGVLLRFAALKYGSAAPSHGYRLADGRDFSALWAAKGSASYALPINGKRYTVSANSRGEASVTIQILANGTYNVITFVTGRSPTQRVDDTGTWLPSGESAANWSVQLDASFGDENVVPDKNNAASNTITNDATTVKTMTSDHAAKAASNAPITGGRASSSGTIKIRLYRLGVLRTTTTITFDTNVNGN